MCKGRSKPNWARNLAISSGVAWSGSSRALGSPDRCTNRNTTMLTTMMVARACSSRWIINWYIPHRPSDACLLGAWLGIQEVTILDGIWFPVHPVVHPVEVHKVDEEDPGGIVRPLWVELSC